MEFNIKDTKGGSAGTVDGSDYIWNAPMNEALLHQVIVAQQANRRQGTHDTKRRSNVISSGRKLRAQKGTGRARIGASSAPGLRGGGVAHGPHPRSYRQRIPVRARTGALRVALSEQNRRASVVILDKLELNAPSTRHIHQLVENLGLANRVLIITENTDRLVLKSVRNLRNVDVLAASLLNPLAAYTARSLLITEEALRRIDELWGAENTRSGRKTLTARASIGNNQ